MTRPARKPDPTWPDALLAAVARADSPQTVVALVTAENANLEHLRAKHYGAYLGLMAAIDRRIDELKAIACVDNYENELQLGNGVPNGDHVVKVR